MKVLKDVIKPIIVFFEALIEALNKFSKKICKWWVASSKVSALWNEYEDLVNSISELYGQQALIYRESVKLNKRAGVLLEKLDAYEKESTKIKKEGK